MKRVYSLLDDNTQYYCNLRAKSIALINPQVVLKTNYYHWKTFRCLVAGFLFFLLLLGSHSLKAGWIITGKFIDQDGKTILQRYFIQDFKVKFEQYNIIYSFDFKTNSLILVDPINLEYYQGTIEGFINGMKKYKNQQLDLILKDVPENQKIQVQAEYQLLIDRIGTQEKPTTDSVNIVRVNDSLKVFGKVTEKYLVTMNNRRTEETWISTFLDITPQFSWERYLYFLSVVEPENVLLKYMSSAPYLQLLSKGFPVRRITVAGGYRNEFQFTRMEEKIIEEYEFYTPASCKELTLDQWMSRNNDKETKYDDYE